MAEKNHLPTPNPSILRSQGNPAPTDRISALEKRLQQAKERAGGLTGSIPHLPDRDKAPLSFAQKRLWFIHLWDPASPAYNRPTALRLLGKLDLMALEKSLNEIVRRHETLRTTFPMVGDEPVQQVNPPAYQPLPIEDLTQIPADQQMGVVRAAMENLARQGFDLEKGPLCRWHAFRLASQMHLLLFVSHHIVFDGWSERIFQGELFAIYQAFSNGEIPELPGLPIQYIDYAAWLYTQDQEKEFEKQLSYWKEKLAGPLPVFELPISRRRPARRSDRGATYAFRIQPSLAKELNEWSQQQGATLFMTLLATFATLLYRYSGQEDLLIGTPVAGRNRRELESLIGCFLNNLVLRCSLSGELAFKELLKQIRQVCLEAYDHQEAPFEKLVDVLQPERSLSRTPIFQVMFNMKNFPVGKHLTGTLPGKDLTFEPLDVDIGVARFDLSLEMTKSEDEILGKFHYSIDLFEPSDIQKMAGHFQTLLTNIPIHPEEPIGQLPLLTEAERRQILVDWNNTARAYPADRCIHEVFADQVERTPDIPAVVFEGISLTYAELNLRANQLARRLQKQGVRPGSLVGLMVERSAEMLVGILGILKAGGAYLPLDPSYPKERLDFMLEDSRAAMLITKEQLNFQEPGWEQQLAETIASALVTNPESGAGPDHPMYVIYTSGSTGKPKGVAISHRSALNLATALHESIYARLPAGPLRVGLNAPMSFDASVKQLLVLLMGHTLYLIPHDVRLDGKALLNYIRTHRLEVLDCVPSQLKLLLGAGLLDEQSWQPLAILPGGEAIDEDTWRELAKATRTEFFNMYGPTECTVDSAIARVKDRPDRPVIGRAVANTRLYVLNPWQQPAPVGVPGELYIGGAGVAQGYLNRPELTAQHFVPYPQSLNSYIPDLGAESRLYKTGDLVRWLADGNLEFLGRIDRQVKVRGYRIELGEIEAALSQHPQVEQAIVEGHQDPYGDTRLTAYLVPKRNTEPGREALRDFLKQRLPDYMVPSVFVILEAFPLTANGKIDRKALAAISPSAAGHAQPEVTCSEKSRMAPSTPVEKVISRIWAGILGLEPVDALENFFDLGGHSLLAARLIARVRDTFQIDIPLSCLFENPTVASFSQALIDSCDQPEILDQLAQYWLSLEELSEAELEAMLMEQQTFHEHNTGGEG